MMHKIDMNAIYFIYILRHHSKYSYGVTISLFTWGFGIYDAVIKPVNICLYFVLICQEK